jgi:hypothetical protein
LGVSGIGDPGHQRQQKEGLFHGRQIYVNP